jgi:hypothetical protein
MSKSLTNSIQDLVTQKVEEVAHHPGSTYHSAFLRPRLREKLVLRMMERFPYRTTSLSDSENLAEESSSPFYVFPERDVIISLIEESMVDILREENTLQYFSEHELKQTQTLEPSHWFG